MNTLHALVAQGITRESIPCKWHLKGGDPVFDEIRVGVVCLPSETIYTLKTGGATTFRTLYAMFEQ